MVTEGEEDTECIDKGESYTAVTCERGMFSVYNRGDKRQTRRGSGRERSTSVDSTRDLVIGSTYCTCTLLTSMCVYLVLYFSCSVRQCWEYLDSVSKHVRTSFELSSEDYPATVLVHTHQTYWSGQQLQCTSHTRSVLTLFTVLCLVSASTCP